MVSPLGIKVVAGAAALISGVLGGAFIAGAASPSAQTPSVVGSTTPSRVASPSALPAQAGAGTTFHPPAPTPPAPPAKHAKHHPHGKDTKTND